MPDNDILNYAPPAPPRSPIPIFGVIVCTLGILCGAAIIGFGVWWLIMTGVAGLLRGAAICLAGALIICLCLRWYFNARRAMLANDPK